MTTKTLCGCGHGRHTHEHYRRGSDCGICGPATCRSFHTGASAKVLPFMKRQRTAIPVADTDLRAG